jgi:VWFA-related protein
MPSLHFSRWLAAVAVSSVTLSWQGHAQQTPAPARAAGTLQTGVTAVLVDVVVRDKRGQPVRDLRPSEFEVFEDGILQPITSVTGIFEGTPTAPLPADPEPAATPSGRESGVEGPGGPEASPLGTPVTALVFDRLTPEARRLALRAARSYLADRPEAPHMIGVFGIDLAFTPYAPFTRDTQLLGQAFDTIERRASSSFGMDREQMKLANAQAKAAASAADAAIGGAGGANPQNMGATADAQLAQMAQRMQNEFEALDRNEQGYTFVNSLAAIINTMRSLRGRKSLVLFSEGLAIPPAVQPMFVGLVDAANRANVSIYTMDAAGLRAESEQAKMRDQINAAGSAGLQRRSVAVGKTDGPMMEELEKNEDVLRQDPATGLGDLASGTGGQLFQNTNNLRQGFERIESDLRNYYLIGYTPTNATYDGKFRNIVVRLKRGGLTVAARKGYFAVRHTGGAPVTPWEAPALAALERRPVPNAFPVRAAALSFPAMDRPGVVPVVVHLKTEPMTFTPSSDQQSFTSDFAIVVRFLGPRDEVVRRVGQHYEMSAPTTELQRAKNSDVIFYREPELPPGLYTMETIVYDNLSGKGSVRYATVEVPEVDPAKLRMSSLLLVQRLEKVGEEEPRTGPLYVKDVLVYPNLGEPVSKAASTIGFFFTLYPGTASTDTPQAALELMQNGKLLAKVPVELPPADGSGRIQQLGRLPLEALAPGTYELRAVARQGSGTVVRSTMLHLTE